MCIEIHKQKLKKALLKVGKEYFGIPDSSGKIHYLERAFAYELYHQLRMIYNKSDKNYYVNGEIVKYVGYISNQHKQFIPDLVIHTHITTSNNEIAIEIKTNKNVTSNQIYDDLKKLNRYTDQSDNQLKYKLGVLIIVNSNFNKKAKKMKSEINELLRINKSIEVWNIITPESHSDMTNQMKLEENCLTILHEVS